MSLRTCRRLARAGAAVAAAIAGLALVGWISGFDLLTSLIGGTASMKFNTALCTLALGGALWVLIGRPPWWLAHAARCAGVGVMLFGAAVFLQHVTGRSLGLEHWLLEEAPGAVGSATVNRPAPYTAIGFVLLGAAVLLLDARVRGRRTLAPVLAGVAAAVALAALAGYLTGMISLNGVNGAGQMSVPTSLAFLGLSLGVLLARPERAPANALISGTAGGEALRRLLPAAVLAPVAISVLHHAGEAARLYPLGDWPSVLFGMGLAVPLVWRLAGSLDRAELVNRRAEVLRAAEARARGIVDTAYDAFVAADPSGRITSWNDAAEELFGYTAGEALGRDIELTLVPERLRDDLRRDFAHDVQGVRPDGPPIRRTLETTARRRDGREIPVELIVAFAHEEGGVMFHAFVRDITERHRAHDELRTAQYEVLHRLAIAAEYRDDNTGEHTRRVGELSAQLATRVGLAADEVELLRRAAPLHDVGKIGVPDSILLKSGRLTPAEFDEVKKHTLIGADMLAGGGFPLLEMAERIALTHHERWDGTGYPHGLAGESIPIVGRIVALADVFDALTNIRPYKAAWTVVDALAEIELQRGRQFDPALTDAFLEMMGGDRPRAASVAAVQVAR